MTKPMGLVEPELLPGRLLLADEPLEAEPPAAGAPPPPIAATGRSRGASGLPKISVAPSDSVTDGAAGWAAGAPAAGAAPPPMAATGRFSGGGGPPALPEGAPPGVFGGSLVTGALGWPPQPLMTSSNPTSANHVTECLTTVCLIWLSSTSGAGIGSLATTSPRLDTSSPAIERAASTILFHC